jgi:hypothetical protein
MREGKRKDRPLLGVCGVRARTSADSRDALLFAGSLLRMVSKTSGRQFDDEGRKNAANGRAWIIFDHTMLSVKV